MSDLSLGLDFITEDRARSVTTERRPVRIALILIAFAFLALFLILPLVAVFTEAFRAGLGAFWQAIVEPDALAAIRLTLLVAAIAVPANLIFGLAASWAIAKFEFPGKSRASCSPPSSSPFPSWHASSCR
jgi:sulfate transport system permease protein